MSANEAKEEPAKEEPAKEEPAKEEPAKEEPEPKKEEKEEANNIPVLLENEEVILLMREIIVINENADQPTTIHLWNRSWIGLPNVFQPSIWLPSSEHYINKPIAEKGDIFLEIGTGAGIYACKASLDGASLVIATDINPTAIENVLLNAKMQHINNDNEEKLIAFESDIFNNKQLQQYQSKIDKIFWNFPFVYLKDNNVNKRLGLIEMAVFDPGYQLLHRYFKEASLYLKKNIGKLYICWSKHMGDEEYLFYAANLYNWDIKLFDQIILSSQGNLSFQLWELTLIESAVKNEL